MAKTHAGGRPIRRGKGTRRRAEREQPPPEPARPVFGESECPPPRNEDRESERIDEASWESFPASDPPTWVPSKA